jgi:hypothetical protein
MTHPLRQSSRLGYNLPMRVIFAMLLFFACLLQAALAADDSDWATDRGPGHTAQPSCASAARDCCGMITSACVELKYRPRCDWPEHRCVTPYLPCPPCICIEPVCHKPLTPCIPEAPCVCTEPVCHKPVVVVMPEDPCEE